MSGFEMCQLTKDEFLDRTPGCVGDILYEHLQLLQHDAERNEVDSPPVSTTTTTMEEQPQDLSESQINNSSNQSQIEYENMQPLHRNSKQQQHVDSSLTNNNISIKEQPQDLNDSNSNLSSSPQHQQQLEYSSRSFEDLRQMPLHYSNYDTSPYGNSIYAAMAAFRTPYPAMPSQHQNQFLGGNPYSDHYQFQAHSAYNPALFHGQVSLILIICSGDLNNRQVRKSNG